MQRNPEGMFGWKMCHHRRPRLRLLDRSSRLLLCSFYRGGRGEGI